MNEMQLRPYQQEFIDAVRRDFAEHDRLLGVAATGAGKTIIGSELMRGWSGNCLFLADAKDLVAQNADKYMSYCGEICGVEQGDSHALPGDRVVIATAQSMARRIDKWPENYFDLIIVDEAHRNTLGGMAQTVLSRFPASKVLGVTATPWRSDRQQLGSYYEKIAIEIGLPRLIREKWLAPITVKSVPLPVDLQSVRTTAGDYNEADLGAAIAPHLLEAAKLLQEHAAGRPTVVFLPLIATSKEFVDACRSIGLRAVHADGNDREGVRAFERGEYDILANAALCTTGWDCPRVSCVFPLRVTKSLSLFQQMVGRGTRLYKDKTDLLLLDPLYLTDDHSLVKAARLIAKNEEQAKALSEKFENSGGDGFDLLETDEQVKIERESKLAKELKAKAKRRARTVDAVEFALSLHASEAAEYEPEMAWEKQPPSEKQMEVLMRAGFDADSITCKGHASKILDLLFTRRNQGLASPKQVKFLRQYNYPNPDTATFDEASAFLDKVFSRTRQGA